MKYIIVGNSVYADMLCGYICENDENDVVAYTVEKEYISSLIKNGRKVVSYEEIEQYYSPKEVLLLMAVGYSEMNDIKERLFNLYKSKGYQFATYIHPSAIIATDIDMGEGNVFFEGTIVQRGVKLGDGNVLFAKTMIAHDCIIGSFNSFSSASLGGNVTIGNKCFVGMGAVIGENVNLDDQVFVGANAYVNTDLKKGRAALGIKAKIIDREISKRIL